MKKKLLLCLILIVCTLAVMTGCSNTPAYKTLSLMWNAKEVAVYSVENKISETETVRGTYTITVEKIKAPTISVGDLEITGYENIGANLITSELAMENGDSQKSVVLVKNSFQTPSGNSIASFKTSQIGDKFTSVSARYDNDKYTFYTTDKDNNKSETSSISTGNYSKSPYFDNDSIALVLRCARIDKKKPAFSMPFTIPSWNEGKMLKLTALLSNASVKLVNPNFGEIESLEYRISLIQNFPGPGSPLLYYTSKEPITAEGGSVTRAILKIVEGKVTYTLKTLTTQVE